jgi:hypothetical protein
MELSGQMVWAPVNSKSCEVGRRIRTIEFFTVFQTLIPVTNSLSSHAVKTSSLAFWRSDATKLISAAPVDGTLVALGEPVRPESPVVLVTERQRT